MKGLILLFLFSFFLLKPVKSQDTLRLLNGNILLVKIGEVKENTVTYLLPNKAKHSFSERDKENLFSYTREGGKEIMIYEYNPDRGNIYEVSEMRYYMLGEKEASKYYKSNISKYISLGGGAVAGYFMADDKLFSVTAPLVISSVILLPGVRVKKNEMNEAYRKNQPYRDGYKREAKGKKFFNSFKYSAMGLIGSFVYFKYIDG